MGDFAQIIGLGIGWLLVGWVCVQALAFGWQRRRRQVRWQREYERGKVEFCRRVEAAARAGRAAHAIADWNGWRPFRVAAVVDEAQDVKSFYFAPIDEKPLAPYAPGQYLTFRIPIADSDAPVVRCYSLSEHPREDYYRTTIKRIRAPNRAGARPGRGSGYFHDCVRVGDVLEVRAPAGTFLIDPLAEEPIVLIGCGIGITPLMSMLESIGHAGRRREVYALFGFRNGAEHPFQERLARLAEAHPEFHIQVSYSAPREVDRQFRDYHYAGRWTMERIRKVLPSSNFHFYLCGPAEFMESLVPALWDWGVPESHVHYEAFGPASVKSASARRKQIDQAAVYDVSFQRSDRVVSWDGSFASLLEFGQAAGIAMPSGCRAGSCGECMMAVLSGSIQTIKPPGIPVPSGHCLTCISVPGAAVVLDA